MLFSKSSLFQKESAETSLLQMKKITIAVSTISFDVRFLALSLESSRTKKHCFAARSIDYETVIRDAVWQLLMLNDYSKRKIGQLQTAKNLVWDIFRRMERSLVEENYTSFHEEFNNDLKVFILFEK